VLNCPTGYFVLSRPWLQHKIENYNTPSSASSRETVDRMADAGGKAATPAWLELTEVERTLTAYTANLAAKLTGEGTVIPLNFMGQFVVPRIHRVKRVIQTVLNPCHYIPSG
jgi:hypothetical protein